MADGPADGHRQYAWVLEEGRGQCPGGGVHYLRMQLLLPGFQKRFEGGVAF